MVAVQSRLQTTATPSHPLAGWRVAVKDIFQIEGLKTSVCNRAFYDLYPPASQTAACIKLLEEKGALILGTTKLAAFAATEEPIECVDYQAPWNPRADGYQSPAGSSSGSGVAVASYQWVDIAVGSDSKFQSSSVILFDLTYTSCS
jgi:Asp-tRNA(Asn)/Glu-tRNA(Gln) amidotransferase A subunit family amidase